LLASTVLAWISSKDNSSSQRESNRRQLKAITLVACPNERQSAPEWLIILGQDDPAFSQQAADLIDQLSQGAYPAASRAVQ
jgi:hypothetical protein